MNQKYYLDSPIYIKRDNQLYLIGIIKDKTLYISLIKKNYIILKIY